MASLAARFAAKEALAKALGAPTGMGWLDAEVVSESTGDPRFEIRGSVLARADELGVAQRARLAVPRRRHRLGRRRPGVLSRGRPCCSLTARFADLRRRAPAAARAVRSSARSRSCCSAGRSGSGDRRPRAGSAGSYAVALPGATVPSQVFQLTPGDFDARRLARRCSCATSPGSTAVWALWTRARVPTALTYFWGLTLSVQGIITPSLAEAFPHPRVLRVLGDALPGRLGRALPHRSASGWALAGGSTASRSPSPLVWAVLVFAVRTRCST